MKRLAYRLCANKICIRFCFSLAYYKFKLKKKKKEKKEKLLVFLFSFALCSTYVRNANMERILVENPPLSDLDAGKYSSVQEKEKAKKN